MFTARPTRAVAVAEVRFRRSAISATISVNVNVLSFYARAAAGFSNMIGACFGSGVGFPISSEMPAL